MRITDADGMRITCFVTNTPDRPIADLELRHRLRARAEDRIRAARSTGMRNLPLHDTAQNRVWLEIVQIALSTCWPGCPCSPLPARQGSGNRAVCGSTCSLRPASSSHRSAPHPPSRPPLALDPRDHRRPRTARTPAEPRLTSGLPCPYEKRIQPRSGTRRPAETTPGSSACPPPATDNEMGPDSVAAHHERGIARLKRWRIFRHARCSPSRMTSLTKAVLTLERHR